MFSFMTIFNSFKIVSLFKDNIKNIFLILILLFFGSFYYYFHYLPLQKKDNKIENLQKSLDSNITAFEVKINNLETDIKELKQESENSLKECQNSKIQTVLNKEIKEIEHEKDIVPDSHSIGYHRLQL